MVPPVHPSILRCFQTIKTHLFLYGKMLMFSFEGETSQLNGLPKQTLDSKKRNKNSYRRGNVVLVVELTISCLQNKFHFCLSVTVNGMSTNICLVSLVKKKGMRRRETLFMNHPDSPHYSKAVVVFFWGFVFSDEDS